MRPVLNNKFARDLGEIDTIEPGEIGEPTGGPHPRIDQDLCGGVAAYTSFVQRDTLRRTSATATMPSGLGGVPPQGTPKRAREVTELDSEGQGDVPLTLAVLQQALQVNQQQITESIHKSLAGIGQRVAQVEVNMEEHVKRITELLDAMTDRHVSIERNIS